MKLAKYYFEVEPSAGPFWRSGAFNSPCMAIPINQRSHRILIESSCGRRGGLMVSALVPGSSGPGSSPGWGHCVVFFGKTFYSHSASLHPGVQMGTGELLGKPNKLLGVTCDGLASRPGGVAILLAASCYRNRDKLRQL